ncbi:DUF1694 domain-containing protein [Bacillus lacus]|uniref:DUF1694 domain-containing protein n=1 Tax=Metabacillus lacus TaxID=1983721 RepID=A0A7X2J170_9BACI|nr:YueI family protein [Metabacillus lacus]MRX73561.1 DUF1694 domain-containing protein [Metabacillus lacus]
MSDDKMDLYLKQGMYGPYETLPEERNFFLGTIRERVLVALTTGQVRQNSVYSIVKEKMQARKNGKLLLNGKIDYSALSKYVKLANDERIEFSIISDLDRSTKIGLVYTADYAVEEEEIYVKDDVFQRSGIIEK